MAAVLVLGGCGGEQAAPSDGAHAVTTVTAESHAAADAAVVTCRQVVASAGVMVRDYNAFVRRLNATHDYARIDPEDRYARETLDTGADLIRRSLSPEVPDDLEQRVHRFVSASEQLAEQIAQRRKLALNKSMDEWAGARTDLIDACGEFMPTGAG